MLAYEIIHKKQQGKELTRQELYQFITGYIKGTIPDYQMSAFLMAVYFQGMSDRETFALVEAMIDSGQRIDLSHIKAFKVDKHSTGGVGDKVSIPLTPLVAAAGVKVPMISGRGLGHTGGTLDKLESIPGFRVQLSVQEFTRQVETVGACIMEQNNEIVPADKKMYALRDVTSTVRSIPLMCGSIMSKKIAEGIDGLVLDVKTGNGAFIQDYNKSELLAEKLKRIGEHFGLKVDVLITDMNQPLGYRIGNWLEIEESIQLLKGEGPEDLLEITLEIGSRMVLMAGVRNDIESAEDLLKELLSSGQAYEKFLEFVSAQGGEISYIEHPETYPKARFLEVIPLPKSGYLQHIDTLALGLAAVVLGAGRKKMGDEIDNTAGIILHHKLGDQVQAGQPFCTLQSNQQKYIEEARRILEKAITIVPDPVKAPPLIHGFL